MLNDLQFPDDGREEPVPAGRLAGGDGPLTRSLGQVLATERARCGFTVAELARRAQVSTGSISQLERGMGNPSLETVASLARALGVPIGSFFAGAPVEGNVVRAHARKKLVLGDGSVTYEMLVPDLSGRLSVLAIELPAHFTNQHSPFEHVGEEVVLVVNGVVQVHVGESHAQLGEGDSIRINAAIPHWYATGTKLARLISTMTPPSF